MLSAIMQGLDQDKSTRVGWRAPEWAGGDYMSGVGMGRMMGEQGETWKEGETQEERLGHRDTGHKDERAQGDSLSMPK